MAASSASPAPRRRLHDAAHGALARIWGARGRGAGRVDAARTPHTLSTWAPSSPACSENRTDQTGQARCDWTPCLGGERVQGSWPGCGGRAGRVNLEHYPVPSLLPAFPCLQGSLVQAFNRDNGDGQ